MPNSTSTSSFRQQSWQKVLRLSLLVLGLIVVVSGGLFTLLWQQQLTQEQDLRSDASQQTTADTVELFFQVPAEAMVGQSLSIPLRLTASEQHVDGVQVFFTARGVAQGNVSIDVANVPGLNVVAESVNGTDAFTDVSVLAVSSQIGSGVLLSDTTFLTLNITPNSEGTLSLTFDEGASKSNLHGADTPTDILVTRNASINVVSANNDDQPTDPVACTFSYSAWSACTKNSQTRTIVSTSPDGCDDSNPAALERSCQSDTVADDDNNDQDDDNNDPTACSYSYSSWSSCQGGIQTRSVTEVSPSNCDTSLNDPETIRTCDVGTGGSDIRNCNESCNSNDDCATNLLCYNTSNGNRCRFASNPSSSSCAVGSNSSTQSQTTVIENNQVVTRYVNACNLACTTTSDCPLDQLTCYQGACRLASDPTNATCTPTTQRVVTQTEVVPGGIDPKGSSPSASPAVSPSPLATAGGQIQVTPRPQPTIPPTQTPVASPQPASQAWSQLASRLNINPELLPLLAAGLVALIGLILIVLILRQLFGGSKPRAKTAYKLNTVSSRPDTTTPPLSSVQTTNFGTKSTLNTPPHPLNPTTQTSATPVPDNLTPNQPPQPIPPTQTLQTSQPQPPIETIIKPASDQKLSLAQRAKAKGLIQGENGQMKIKS